MKEYMKMFPWLFGFYLVLVVLTTYFVYLHLKPFI